MTRQIKAASTDVSVVLRIIDSTAGTPETGVVFNTTGIDLQYRREGAASVDITEATLAALTTAHADGGFLHIGNGYYRLDLPDAAVATGATGVLVHGTVTGMVVIGEYIELVAYDPQDAVRLGLTALPNAAADAAGGLPISDAGGLDLDAKLAATNEVTAARMGALTDWINGGRLDLILDIIAADVVNLDGSAMRGTDSASTHSAADVWAAVTRVLTANTNLNDPTAAVIADAVWDEAQSGHVGAGTFGEVATETAAILVDTAEIGAAGAGLTEAGGTGDQFTALPWNVAWDAEVQSEATDALNAYDPPTKAELDSGLAALNDPTAATVAAAVWDALQSAHVTAGSFGELATEIAAILADTNELQTDDVPGLIAALNDLSAAAVNAEVVDVLMTDTLTELAQAAPSATPTFEDALMLLHMALRNKVDVTATLKEIHNDAGTVIAKKTLSDDGTTYSEAEMVTGP